MRTARLPAVPRCRGPPAEFAAETHPHAGFLLQGTCHKWAQWASKTCELPEDGAALPLSIILPLLGDMCSARGCSLLTLSRDLGKHRACSALMVLPSPTQRCAGFAQHSPA